LPPFPKALREPAHNLSAGVVALRRQFGKNPDKTENLPSTMPKRSFTFLPDASAISAKVLNFQAMVKKNLDGVVVLFLDGIVYGRMWWMVVRHFAVQSQNKINHQCLSEARCRNSSATREMTGSHWPLCF
jgi:hypothetical protein